MAEKRMQISMEHKASIFAAIWSVFWSLMKSNFDEFTQEWANYGPRDHFVRPASPCKHSKFQTTRISLIK